VGVQLGLWQWGGDLGWGLEKVFGPKGDKATEEWRRLHYKELCNPYCSPKACVIKSERIR